MCNCEQAGSAWRDIVGVYRRGTEWPRMLPSDDGDGLDVQATERTGETDRRFNLPLGDSDDRRCRHRPRAAEQFLATALINSPDECLSIRLMALPSVAGVDVRAAAAATLPRKTIQADAGGRELGGRTDNVGPVLG